MESKNYSQAVPILRFRLLLRVGGVKPRKSIWPPGATQVRLEKLPNAKRYAGLNQRSIVRDEKTQLDRFG